MATIPYIPWKNRNTRSQLLSILLVLLPILPLQGRWETPKISVGTSLMSADAKVQDIQNFRALIVDIKLWQSKVLQNTLIFMLPATVSFFVDGRSNNESLLCNAVTLKAEAFFVPLSATRRFAPFITSSFGPAVFEKRKLGPFRQGGHIGFQSTFGIGTYLTQKCSFTSYVLHYCNAGLYKRNNGLTIPVLAGGLTY